MNNTLKYVKALESAGISREQAEVHVQLVTEIMEGDLATKQDIKNLETKLDTSVERLEHSIERLDHKINTSVDRLENKIEVFTQRLENKIIQSEYRMTIKLGTIVTVAIAAATAVIKLL